MNNDSLLRIITQIILQHGTDNGIEVAPELSNRAKEMIDTHVLEFGGGRISLIPQELVSLTYRKDQNEN